MQRFGPGKRFARFLSPFPTVLGRGFLLGFLILQYMFDDNDSIDCKLHAFCYTMMRGYSGNRLLLNP